jgi:hypothetical protein
MSFSSKFDFRLPRHCTALLLVLCASLSMISELSARYAFPRISRIYRRIELERKSVLRLAQEPDRPAVLLVGNSLFEKGIDVNTMQQELPGYNVRRYVISATSSLDWYYGLRKLLGEGIRPQAVVAGFSVRQLLAQTIEGDLSVHLLVGTADVTRLGRDLNKYNTELSNLYFANLSDFYGSRTEFRKWLLAKMLPDVERLSAAIVPRMSPVVVNAVMMSTAAKRLQMLSDTCAGMGAKFVLVIPPARDERNSVEAVSAVQEAGRQVGVPVLAPIRPGEWGAEYFSDGIHLTPASALKFTSLLSSDLRRTMSDTVTKGRGDSKERIAEVPRLRSVANQ